MRFFSGLHRIVIVLAVCVFCAVAVHEFSEYKAMNEDLDRLRWHPVNAFVDGELFGITWDATPSEVQAKAKEEGRRTGVPWQDIHTALSEQLQQRREEIANEEQYLARFPVFWFGSPPAAGGAFYVLAMAVLLVGRWIMRGFLTPP